MNKEVLTQDGFEFVLFAREQQRMHVHVFAEHGEAKFWLEPRVIVAESQGLSDADLEKIEKIIWDNHLQVRNGWREHDGKHAGAEVVEVNQITKFGVWVMLAVRAYGDVELWLPYADYPEFENADEAAVRHVARPRPSTLEWPELGVTLALGNLHDPKLRYQVKRRA